MLQESMRKRHEGEGGFTLIELLIVIVILGVLSAVVVFAVGGISSKGNQAACNSDTKSVETAQEAYYAGATLGNGTYAANVAALVSAKLLREAPSTSNGYTITTNTTGVVTSSPACSTLK
jgi:prepilin-type N-terminal cleavage/methylation domain-containing protein